MRAVFDEMQNDDIVAIASAATDYLTLIEFLKAKGKTVLGFAQYQPSLSPLLSEFYGTLCVVKNGCVYRKRAVTNAPKAQPELPPPLPVISEALFGTVPIRRGPALGDGGHLHMDNATKLEWCKDFPKLAKRIKPIVS